MDNDKVREALSVFGRSYNRRVSLSFLEKLKAIKLDPHMPVDEIKQLLNKCDHWVKMANSSLGGQSLQTLLMWGQPVFYLSEVVPAPGLPTPMDGLIFTEVGAPNPTDLFQVECWPIEIDCSKYPEWWKNAPAIGAPWGLGKALQDIGKELKLPCGNPYYIAEDVKDYEWFRKLKPQTKTTIHVLCLKHPSE